MIFSQLRSVVVTTETTRRLLRLFQTYKYLENRTLSITRHNLKVNCQQYLQRHTYISLSHDRKMWHKVMNVAFKNPTPWRTFKQIFLSSSVGILCKTFSNKRFALDRKIKPRKMNLLKQHMAIHQADREQGHTNTRMPQNYCTNDNYM